MAKHSTTQDRTWVRYYNGQPYDPVERSRSTGLHCQDTSLARQDQEAQANINNIVKAFGVTGKLPIVPNLPEYGDFTDSPSSYQEALARLEAAEDAFYTVPAEIRAKFNNNPAEFFDAVHRASKDELKAWGLSPPDPEPIPAPAPPPEA